VNEPLDGFAVMRRNGDIFTVAVDPEDYERVEAAGSWYMHCVGRKLYCRRRIRRAGGGWTTQYLHTFLGFPGGDHIDLNGLNNCKSNLRKATVRLNAQNRHLNSNNTSGHRGVCFDRRSGKWLAHAGLNNKFIYLGLYVNIKDAARAAAEYRAKNMPFSADARSEGE